VKGRSRPGVAGLVLAVALLLGGSCTRAGRKATLPPLPSPAPAEAPVSTVPPSEAAAPTPAAPLAQPVPPLPDGPAAADSIAPPPGPFPDRVRIGLATDLELVTLPCCEGELSVDVGGDRLDVASPLRIRPATTSVGGLFYRVQVAALKDEDQAHELARRLGKLAGEPADARFDAQAGIYRVRLGRHADRAAAEAASRRLARFGVDRSWIVSEGAALGEPALELQHRGKIYRVEGRSFALAAPAEGGVRWEGKRYRGRLVVYLNDRGRLNLVNELGIEEYLRGVVPRELGPNSYPELAALKAQAVAARSYTLRNLGEFSDEGYDLCGTPRCQVYGGMDDEHPLSDRAIAETRGEVLVFGGEPIDALYSATCGGHTENVEVIFPLKRAAYLRGVPCIEAGETRLAGSPPSGAPAARGVGEGESRLPKRVLARALPEASSPLDSARALERALVRLAEAAGLATPADHLLTLERREVQRFVGSMFDLAADARLFVRPEELGYLVSHPPAGWNEQDRRLAAYLVESGLLQAPAGGSEGAVPAEELERLVLELAVFLRVVEVREATFSALVGRDLVARDDGSELHLAVPGDLATFRIEAGRTRPGDLVLAAGDRLELYLVEGGLVAVAHTVDPRGAGFDRTHNLSRWTRFRSDDDLRLSVAGRLPGFDFRGFEVLMRGVSGRVGKIRLVGRNAETLDVEGLAVRWTLDLPDTLFTSRRLTPANGKAGWQFSGRGWGHGVGLCQVGAYGMARRGHGYRAILAHYYSGATLSAAAYGGAGSAAAGGVERSSPAPAAPIAAPGGPR
jgi:stage II sporulation protein D